MPTPHNSSSTPSTGTEGDSMFRVRSLVNSTDWTGDSIRVTNCDEEGCESDPNVLVDGDGIPIEYTCKSLITSGPIAETAFSIDYEALIPVTADPDHNVRQLHWRILLAAVQESGLDKCDFDLQHALSDGQLRHLAAPMDESTTLFSIRNDLDASSAIDMPCTELISDQVMQCIPVRTVLTLQYQGTYDNQYQVQDYIHDLLEQQMMDRSYDLLVTDVEKIEYVGDFDAIVQDRGDQYTDTMLGPYYSDNASVVRIGSIISASSAVMLLLTIIFFRRRKLEGGEENTECVEEKETTEIHDLETGSTHSTEIPTSSSAEMMAILQAISSDSGHSSAHSHAQDDDIVAVSGSGTGNENDAQSEDAVVPPATSYDSGEQAGLDLIAAAAFANALPPRPPRRESVKLKKRRRRKKRKKKPILKRVNSRENVNPMEAILESEDEGSEFESESGSEFSTDDEGTGSNHSRSSGCQTPVRSQPNSRTSSRASSPQLSPSDELFPSDVFSSDFDFIIEAPNFPFEIDKKNKDTADSKVPLQPRKTTSAKEEKNVGPIPLLWI